MNFILTKKPSKIHNNGLFVDEDIPSNLLIIEYKGQRISQIAADVREILYAQKGISHLFNVDDKIVIDGGVDGNLARFINHSCNPNCKIIIKDKRVFIYSKKFIQKGEELNFDYNYNKNTVREYCNCGSKNCRRFINLL